MVYCVHAMKYESLRTFRTDLKNAFDEALKGTPATIIRDGEKYLLVSETAVKQLRKKEYKMPEYVNVTRRITIEPEGRTKGVVLSDIKAIDAELATGINQDPDYIQEQAARKGELWEEYKGL